MATTPKTTRAADETAAAEPSAPELASDTESAAKPLPGGFYINTGGTDLVLLQPAARVKPGHVIELEYGVRHRDLRPATDAEIKAARDAEAAEQAAAAQAAETGQE